MKFANNIVGIGSKTLRIIFKNIEKWDFLIAIKKPLLIKKIGYVGKIMAEIFK